MSDQDRHSFQGDPLHISLEGTLEHEATHRGIPRESWLNEKVKEFLSFMWVLETLQRQMIVAAERPETEELIRTRDLFHSYDMRYTLKERYYSGELILRALLMLMDEGIGASVPSDSLGYVIGKLNVALGQYGLEVVRKPKRP